LYQQSLKLTESIGDVQTKAATLHQIAIIYSQQGRVQEASALYQQSLALTESSGDIQTKAATLHCLGSLKAKLGLIEEAIPLFRQSLEIKESIGDVEGKAMTLSWLGGLAADVQGDFAAALDYLQQSLDILERLQSPNAEIARQSIARVQQMAEKRG
jgi:tetratricopeptide (TPR) repeat protein